MREFAEQEIILPTGPYEGRRFSCSRQPFNRLWFDAIDSGRYRRFAATGPRQSSKTLACFEIPVAYHLFERGENVIVGVPTADMASDKWNEDLLPIIQRTRYRDLLPRIGAGSRGGNSNLVAVRFKNGATLRFMTGGGGDKSRVGFTSRVVAITEADGLDESSETSREADKIAQIEACTQAYGDAARIYLECTVSIETGRIWREINNGSASRIAIRCPHCRLYVTPEREHLTGWQTADDEVEAGDKAAVACPECGATWSETDRIGANYDCILVHKGQEIAPDGSVKGPPPRTETLGFRWNAANNLLIKTATIGKKMWNAARASDEENAEKELNQFWWAKPYVAPTLNLTALDPHLIIKRVAKHPRGRVPDDASRLTLGIDLGKYLAHWVCLAWLPHASPHVVEYGRIEIASDLMGEERALLAALREFRDGVLAEGWDGEKPELALVDCGWQQDAVFAFTAECPLMPGAFGRVGLRTIQACKGFGESRLTGMRSVGETTETGWKLVWAPPGSGYEFKGRVGQPVGRLDANADRWKTWLHARIQTPMGQPGAFTLFDGREHMTFAKHLTAEKKEEVFEAGKGLVTKWTRMHRNNHFGDAASLACVAGHICGERLLGDDETPESVPQRRSSGGGEDSAALNPNAYRNRW